MRMRYYIQLTDEKETFTGRKPVTFESNRKKRNRKRNEKQKKKVKERMIER